MSEMMKLRAKDTADLALISGLLQDALISGADMTFENGNRRFVAVFNRFCWESDGALDDLRDLDVAELAAVDDAPGAFHRTHAGLVVDRVRGVQSKNIDLRDKTKLFNLLSVHELDGQIELLFSGGAALRLKTSGVLAHLSDLGEPWPTKWRPHHGHDDKILAEAADRVARETAP